jgi:ATP-dependent protease HslVU (ClpYQ) peptidase subunit
MTCIVGLVHEGKVYIGGDSAGVAGYDLTVRRDPKVFRNGPFLMGFTGSFRMGQLLRYAFTPPAHPDGMEVHRYLCTIFTDAIRECFKAGGYAKKESEQESGGFYLLGYQGHLFRMEGDYQVGDAADDFDAVGYGEQIARGALYATFGFPPLVRMNLALNAAERMSAGVRSPFTIDVL